MSSGILDNWVNGGENGSRRWAVVERGALGIFWLLMEEIRLDLRVNSGIVEAGPNEECRLLVPPMLSFSFQCYLQ